MLPFSQKGFSLIETILYLAIVGVLVVGFVSYGLEISGSRFKTQVSQDVTSALRSALSRVSYDVRHAASVSNPVPSTSAAELTITDTTGVPVTFRIINNEFVRSIGGQDTSLVFGATRAVSFSVENTTVGNQRTSVVITLTVAAGDENADLELFAQETMHTAALLRQ